MSGTVVTKVSPEVARPRDADFFQDTAAFRGSQDALPSSQPAEDAATTAAAAAAAATAAEEEAVPARNGADDAAPAEVLPAAATPEETSVFDPTPAPDADPVPSPEAAAAAAAAAAVPDAAATLPDALEAAAEEPAPQTQPASSAEDVVLAPSTLQQIEQLQEGAVHDAASLPLEASQDVGVSQDLLGPVAMGPPPTPPTPPPPRRSSAAAAAAPAAAQAGDAAADTAAPLIFSFASSEEAVETVRATDVVVLPEWDQPPAKRVRRSTSAAAAAEPSLKEVVEALQYCTKFGIPHLPLMRLLTRNGTIAAGVIEEMRRDERLVQAYAAFLVLDQTDIEGEDGGLVSLPDWQVQLLASHPLLKQDYAALLKLHPRCLRCRLQWCRQVATRGNPSSLDVPTSSFFPAPACTRADYARLRKMHVDGCVKAQQYAGRSSGSGSPRGRSKRRPNAS